MPGLIPGVGVSDVLGGISSIFNAGNQSSAAQQKAANDRYGVDKSFDLGVLNNQLGKDTLASNEKQAEANRQQQLALQNLAQEFTGGQADISRTAGRGYQESGEKGFLDSVSSAPPELQAAIDSIRQGSTLDQQQAQNQFHNNLESQGVRGPQAATILNRNQGKLTADLSNNVNQMALNNANQRMQAKQNFYGQKSTTGQQAAVR